MTHLTLEHLSHELKNVLRGYSPFGMGALHPTVFFVNLES